MNRVSDRELDELAAQLCDIHAWFAARDIVESGVDLTGTNLDTIVAPFWDASSHSWLELVRPSFRATTLQLYKTHLWLFLGSGNGATLAQVKDYARSLIRVNLERCEEEAKELEGRLAEHALLARQNEGH